MSTTLKSLIVAMGFVLFLNLAASADNWKVRTVYTLPDIRLGSFLQEHLHTTVDDHEIKLGSIGSDLWHAPEDGPGIYWTIGDRGPNGQSRGEGQNRRTFPVPEYTPFILKVKTEDGLIQILEAIPIMSQWDSAATSPSLEALGEAELAANALNVLSKTLIVELDSAQGFPEKVEGIAVLDGKTIAVSNDNDFGVGSFTTDSACRLIDSGVKNHLLVLELKTPLMS